MPIKRSPGCNCCGDPECGCYGAVYEWDITSVDDLILYDQEDDEEWHQNGTATCAVALNGSNEWTVPMENQTTLETADCLLGRNDPDNRKFQAYLALTGKTITANFYAAEHTGTFEGQSWSDGSPEMVDKTVANFVTSLTITGVTCGVFDGTYPADWVNDDCQDPGNNDVFHSRVRAVTGLKYEAGTSNVWASDRVYLDDPPTIDDLISTTDDRDGVGVTWSCIGTGTSDSGSRIWEHYPVSWIRGNGMAGVPRTSSTQTQMTGTASSLVGGTVTGSGTSFTTEFKVHDEIILKDGFGGEQWGIVTAVNSDTDMVIDTTGPIDAVPRNIQSPTAPLFPTDIYRGSRDKHTGVQTYSWTEFGIPNYTVKYEWDVTDGDTCIS